MTQQNDKNPRLDSSTIQQWVRQSAQQGPGAPLAEKEKTEGEIRSNRMEWIDVAASAFCLILSVLLLFLNVTSKADNTLIRVFALLLPPLILFYIIRSFWTRIRTVKPLAALFFCFFPLWEPFTPVSAQDMSPT